VGVCLQPVVEKSKAEKTKCFKYILAEILPVLKQIEQEQNEELEIERKIQGNLNSLLWLSALL
jgi:lysine-specific demethylase 3